MSSTNIPISTKNLKIPLQNESDNEGERQPTNLSNTDILGINDANINNECINTTALNGLRGFVALHIMIFHSILYSKLQLNLLGSVQMPLFFLISGYVFGIGDGKRKYVPTKCCSELNSFPETSFDADQDTLKHFDGKHYYQRRIARTIPMYYLSNILSIPLIYGGHAWIQPGIREYICYVLTLFVATTWLGQPICLNGPSWFVSTMWFFYWIFPSLLPKLQNYTAQRKQKWIIAHYWIQLIVGMGLFIGFFFINPRGAFFTTFWPPSRLPVFIMGILAGLLRNEDIAMKKRQNEFTVNDWRKKCNCLGIGMIIVFIVVAVLDNIFGGIGANLWLQLIIPWWQLQFICALTYDNGESNAHKILASKWLLKLGRISYSLYLVHEPLRQYICWFVYGTLSMPNCDDNDDCTKQWDTWNDKRLMPLWCVPIHWCVSMVIAIILNRFVEEPMRKWLRPTKKN